MQLKLNVIQPHSMNMHAQPHDSLLKAEMKILLDKILTKAQFSQKM
jgi:hypothetical protein